MVFCALNNCSASLVKGRLTQKAGEVIEKKGVAVVDLFGPNRLRFFQYMSCADGS
jgi:hypothetical protein